VQSVFHDFVPNTDRLAMFFRRFSFERADVMCELSCVCVCNIYCKTFVCLYARFTNYYRCTVCTHCVKYHCALDLVVNSMKNFRHIQDFRLRGRVRLEGLGKNVCK